MKGVYSSPDSMNARATQQALFPANTYADDSGGNPEAIPDLTFEECVTSSPWPASQRELAARWCHSHIQPMNAAVALHKSCVLLALP